MDPVVLFSGEGNCKSERFELVCEWKPKNTNYDKKVFDCWKNEMETSHFQTVLRGKWVRRTGVEWAD